MPRLYSGQRGSDVRERTEKTGRFAIRSTSGLAEAALNRPKTRKFRLEECLKRFKRGSRPANPIPSPDVGSAHRPLHEAVVERVRQVHLRALKLGVEQLQGVVH